MQWYRYRWAKQSQPLWIKLSSKNHGLYSPPCNDYESRIALQNCLFRISSPFITLFAVFNKPGHNIRNFHLYLIGTRQFNHVVSKAVKRTFLRFSTCSAHHETKVLKPVPKPGTLVRIQNAQGIGPRTPKGFIPSRRRSNAKCGLPCWIISKDLPNAMSPITSKL